MFACLYRYMYVVLWAPSSTTSCKCQYTVDGMSFQYSLHTYDSSVDIMLDEDVVAPCHRGPGHYIFPYTLHLLSVCIEQVFSHTVSISLQLKSSGCVHPLSHGSGYGTLHCANLCNWTLNSAIVRVHSTKGRVQESFTHTFLCMYITAANLQHHG